MQTITLKIDDNVSEKFLWLLNHFSKNEVTILDQTEFKNDDEYLRSIKGMEQSIIDASNEPDKNFVTIDKLDW
ncbi:hypothetical protein [Sulfurimonas sp. RIFOXYB12_FULL_35_9]|jgi:hypothetical protein|uniref:hypothetical protein n=1 Tax=Sulfurimonas sp. RIFOXYB12_FULL_35_9 TaxID=1802256 RepID=UPI0008C9FCC8|nr:hypothetical protein [Sulfurimonas sp. RIFOXYB12_FULL_35_9]MBS4068683.1 hypothetical protein [Sulfurimonas sp.]OHE03682.1 MAG: hypothetical protein A2345_04860 [Sulfurimonas sp. RIFOXYB12_FULL_35_9]